MKSRLIDLKSLQVFVTFCDYLNMSKTAKVLKLTQPAVSHHIAELEQSLKVTLVDREIRPMQLTPSGKLLKERGIQHLLDLNTTKQLLLNKQAEFTHELRVGISELLSDLAVEVITTPLLKITGTLTIQSNKSSLLFEKLLNRELDVIITSKSGEIYPDLASQLLYQEPIVGIYHNSLTKKLNKNQELYDLIASQASYVEFLPTLTLGIEIKRYFYQLNKQPLPRIKIDSAKNAMQLINSLPSWGIGIPLLMRLPGIKTENIRWFDLPGPPIYSAWHLIYRRYENEKSANLIEKIFKYWISNKKRQYD